MEDNIEKISIKGWIEDDITETSNILDTCPKCGSEMKKVDARKLCGILFVWCPNMRCRYCKVYMDK
ncbi:MAG: hypothetical protein ACPLKS_04750 [Caldisericum exile]|uniref:hypothetical protein n=1 Tax=Caldisericum exile TaxID=693075 RepID=UPI003C74C6B1